MPNSDSQVQLLEQIACSLQELVKLTRIISYPAVRQILETALDTDEKKLVYHFLDGTKTASEIRKLAKVRNNYISQWGREWENLGIVESNSKVKGGRYRSFDITMFGIPVPAIATNSDNGSEKADQDELA
jgi:hypothetical protein